jgi:hypothetical protein
MDSRFAEGFELVVDKGVLCAVCLTYSCKMGDLVPGLQYRGFEVHTQLHCIQLVELCMYTLGQSESTLDSAREDPVPPVSKLVSPASSDSRLGS